jgi:hypothetical protein
MDTHLRTNNLIEAGKDLLSHMYLVKSTVNILLSWGRLVAL